MTEFDGKGGERFAGAPDPAGDADGDAEFEEWTAVMRQSGADLYAHLSSELEAYVLGEAV
ncbi:hypothetical protein F0L17_26235 [Streptomyces sp. TRM43335]|uniref:Uncharacterized protein n=1 Tax=Streptomyces taklimakanensis TaxID=2569853 RepID=A0A6G2BKV5_9ACTN|nr:hypothetical protein [Streptomyces taklimakanensis]MTE22532.1 hypothetical protein [Streptomyces taklimakanensis]